MESPGGFYEVEKDGKLFQFVYHHPKYNPIPNSSDETTNHNHLNTLFLCPEERCQNDYFSGEPTHILKLKSSAEYTLPTTVNHRIVPLYWCNQEMEKLDGECILCQGSYIDVDFYFCETSGQKFRKQSVMSPLKIKHPYHPQHFLHLSFLFNDSIIIESLCCRRTIQGLGYHCDICDVFMHTTCAMNSVPFVVESIKRHDHPLTFFPKQFSLTCNVCGLVSKHSPAYVCLRCGFVAHIDCMNFPNIIKISRHHHRTSYISSLPSGRWSCGVCRQIIDTDYGAYTCLKCDDYFVHSRCALRKDVCDGEELEDVPEEDDITQDDGPFELISEGLIQYFLHEHYLRLEVSIFYDKNKICEVCFLPVYEGQFYSCTECNFIIHEACAGRPRRVQHHLHPHPLTLEIPRHINPTFCHCVACNLAEIEFVYACHIINCDFRLDVRCASVFEPFDFKGHKHPLYLALHPSQIPICEVCKSDCVKQLNCIECDFIICMSCATLPYKARYQHDTHFLTLKFGKEVCKEDWCEACEQNLGDTDTKMFYWCNECCTTLHVECLLGKKYYWKLEEI